MAFEPGLQLQAASAQKPLLKHLLEAQKSQGCRLQRCSGRGITAAAAAHSPSVTAPPEGLMQETGRVWVPPPQPWLHAPHSPACQAYTSQAVLHSCSSAWREAAVQVVPAGATQVAVRIAVPPPQALHPEYCQ
jgi:hypothetical protein